jgi:hypothetical protein
MIKLQKKKKKIMFKERKRKPRKSSEPFKLEQRSQTNNLLNSRLVLNQEAQFLINLILISKIKSNKKQQLKRSKKTQAIFKINRKPHRKQINKNNLKNLSQIK